MEYVGLTGSHELVSFGTEDFQLTTVNPFFTHNEYHLIVYISRVSNRRCGF